MGFDLPMRDFGYPQIIQFIHPSQTISVFKAVVWGILDFWKPPKGCSSPNVEAHREEHSQWMINSKPQICFIQMWLYNVMYHPVELMEKHRDEQQSDVTWKQLS